MYNQRVTVFEVARGLHIDVHELERRKLEFDATFQPGPFRLPDDWKLADPLRAQGSAELLDRNGSKTIRVKGRIDGQVENECARCLRRVAEPVSGDFELYFYPIEMLAGGEEKLISRDDADIGFYEEAGLPLEDAIREQILLWLPMRGLCRDDCKGLCPQCGVNWNNKECGCREKTLDSRWDTLRGWKPN